MMMKAAETAKKKTRNRHKGRPQMWTLDVRDNTTRTGEKHTTLGLKQLETIRVSGVVDGGKQRGNLRDGMRERFMDMEENGTEETTQGAKENAGDVVRSDINIGNAISRM